MYIEIKVPKDININTIISLIGELDPWVIHYDFSVKDWLIRLETIPTNRNVIEDLIKKYARIYIKEKVWKV